MPFMKKQEGNSPFSVRKYLYWAGINVRSQFAYAGIVLESIFTFVVQLLLLLTLWKAIYGDASVINGRSFTQMMQYVLISTTITSLYTYPSIHFLAMDIKRGNIAYDILKPIDFQTQFVFKNIGRIAAVALTILPFSVLFLLVLNLGSTEGSYLCALISAVVGALTCIFFDFVLGSLCFWTENSWGLTFVRQFALRFLSGAFIPPDFLPRGVDVALREYLPFSGMVYWPIRFFTAKFSWNEFAFHIAIQLLWCVFLLFAGRYLYRRIRFRIQINGG